jgi:RluA family pseudouridine synthase
MKDIRCTGMEEGLTVLNLLQNRFPEAPRSYLRQLLRSGKIRRHGLPLAEDHVVTGGDRVQVPESRRLLELLSTPAAPAPEILYESREILAVYKPAGMAVHCGAGHDRNLADWVAALMKSRGEPFRTAPAHRLDAATSGPVLFGKGRQAMAALGMAFQERAVEKIYTALVAGGAPPRSLISSVPAKGKWKDAAAEFVVRRSFRGFSLLEVRLVTGRTHQIRRQLADAGHPLAGDRRYGGPLLPGIDRLFLHCRRLALTSPFDQSPLEIECPLPEELAAALTALAPAAGDRG